MFSFNVQNEKSGIIYYNCNLVNQLSDGIVTPIRASFEQSLNSVLISDVSKYDLCISRFSLSALSIPFWLVPIVPNQPNPTLTPYRIVLRYTSPTNNRSSTGSSNLYFVQNTKPLTTQTNGFSYGYSYDKQDFIDMFNIALQSAMNDLRTNFIATYPTDPTPPPSGDPFIDGHPNPELPVLKYNESFQKFQIYYEESIWTGNYAIKLFVNEILYPLIQFPASNTVVDNLYQLEVATNDNYYEPTFVLYFPELNRVYLVMYSDHNTLGMFTPLSKIVIASTNLPVVSENVQPANNTYSLSTPNAVNQILGARIVTDFEPDYSTTNLVNRDFIQFNQSVNNSRLIGLQGFVPLTRFDLSVYWTDQNNNLHPVMLYNGQSFNIKACFVPKSYVSWNPHS